MKRSEAELHVVVKLRQMKLNTISNRRHARGDGT